MGFKVPYNGKDTLFSAESLVGQILQHIMEYSSDFAGQAIVDAVITVPSYWSQSERQCKAII